MLFLSLSEKSYLKVPKFLNIKMLCCNPSKIQTKRPKYNEPRHEKTNVLHMRKQRRRSASR